MNNQAFKTVKGYELYEKLGAGGFGEVYRAYQPVLQREVAIKVILPDFANEPEFIRRFEAEAQLVARLEHPHIVPLYDYWREPDSAYLVMRWIRGGSLREALQSGGSWDVQTALLLIDQICGALYGAHRRGVVHRDIKPENILIDEDGNAYLTDFGIARVIGRDYADADADEQISGSLHYMAPEQLRGLPILNPQTDLYALGLVVYEILTGQYVFPEATISEVIYNNGNEPIPDIRRLKPAYPAALNDALQKATDKNLEQRFENALTFAQAIRQAFSTEVAPVSPPVDDTHLTNPYKGLRPFDEADSEDFFGREALTWQLLERMREQTPLVRFLAVVGPSGSGKSSVVKAGLLPALRKDELKGASGWIIRAMVPGNQPLRALEEALLSAASKSPLDLYTLLKNQPDGLLQAVEHILGSAETEFLLVIDQFEEIFTFTTDETERAHFLNLLYTAIIAPTTRLRVIVTMRADYYDRPLLYDDFGTLVKSRTEFVLPLMASELERAISGPAARIGLHVGSDLVAAMVDDVRREPGGLPLLQYALTELYEQRDGRNLTLEAYYNSGGVTGALARRAEQVYTRLRAQPQAIARQLFLRLVNPDDVHQDTRRRARRGELLALGDNDMINDVLDTFDKFRLLTFDREPGTREPMVEVAHEALIRNWERLQDWLDDSREDIRLQRRLAAYCAEWISTKRNPDFLLQGGRLLEFETWAKHTELTLTPDEHTYIEQSIKERENLRTLERERKEREVRLVNYSQWVVRALLVAVVIAVIGTVILIAQTQIAARNAAISQSLALADGARYELETGNVDLALALALRANSVDQPPLQAQNALFAAAYAPGTRLVIPDDHDVRVAGFSPDGQFILTGGCAVQT
ncbi:MAG: serine/threonine-protein kinase PknK, partial [Anaerolineae bacterium]|nr:serine/threonine-protein kinase PknK [Anaerolineae bacterium]